MKLFLFLSFHTFVQVIFGLIQPLLLVPASAFMFATRHFTHRIPSPIRDRPAFFRFCKILYGPMKTPMAINAGLQILLAFFITHMEENNFFDLQKQMVKPEAHAEVANEKA